MIAFYVLWFAEKFVSLLIEQHLRPVIADETGCCDLLKNSYLCLLNNTQCPTGKEEDAVVICWKIRIFAYWTTPPNFHGGKIYKLWFAEKFVSLLIEQHPTVWGRAGQRRCDLLKNSYLCLLNNTGVRRINFQALVVICWKIRIFAYWTTPSCRACSRWTCCDLLKNSYLCLLNNTDAWWWTTRPSVVICWKIRIFAYWTTPRCSCWSPRTLLWFAEKFVSLLIEQHLLTQMASALSSCDLLKNSYLCLLNNTSYIGCITSNMLWFAEKFVSLLIEQHLSSGTPVSRSGCDLLKNSYLCLLNNTWTGNTSITPAVVICWKIRIFAYWTTPL